MKKAAMILSLVISAITLQSVTRGETFDNKGNSLEEFPKIMVINEAIPLETLVLCHYWGLDYEWERSWNNDIPESGTKTVMLKNCHDQQYFSMAMTKIMQFENNASYYSQLLMHNADLIFVNREPTDAELQEAILQDERFMIKPIAQDGLVFIGHPENKVENINIEDLKEIYNGEITNWSHLGGDDMVIKPYVYSNSNGMQSCFSEYFSNTILQSDWNYFDDGGMLNAAYYQILKNINAIAFDSYCQYKYLVDLPTTKLFKINGEDSTDSLITSESYPFRFNLYAAIRESEETGSFVRDVYDFITTSEGQQIVKKAGYLTIQSPININGVEQNKPAASVTIKDNIFSLSGDASSNPDGSDLLICAISGVTVLQKRMTENKEDLSWLSPGIYILTWNNDKHTESVKFIKK